MHKHCFIPAHLCLTSHCAALDPYSGYNVDSSSGTGEVPLMGPVKAGSGSSAAYPVYQFAPHEQLEYSRWRTPMRKAPDPYGSTYTAPVNSQYDGSSPLGSTQSRPQVPPMLQGMRFA